MERCIALYETELGTAPSPAVRAAADGDLVGAVRSAASGRAAAVAQLDAGQAAVNAGAIDAGLECLRRAVAEASACGDTGLRLQALNALGGALVHGVRGRDEEGAAVFHEALAGAEHAGDQAAAARAARELGFVDVQAGRRQRAEVWLARAETYADDDLELASVLGVQGMNLSDMAGTARPSRCSSAPSTAPWPAASPRQAAWSGSFVGRIHLLRGDTDLAAAALEEALERTRAERWMAFAPWPESLRAEVDRTSGDAGLAADRYAHAFALACQLGDPCWEGVAARGSGLGARRRRGRPGRARLARGRLHALHALARRLPVGAGLRPRCRLRGRRRRWEARPLRPGSTTSPASAARGSMREFVVRCVRAPGAARPGRGR